MARGIHPRALGALDTDRTRSGSMAIPFVWTVTTTAADSNYYMFNADTTSLGSSEGCPYPGGLRVIYCTGIMTAAAGAGDTVVVQSIKSGTAAAITDTADLTTLADADLFDFSQINDANYAIAKGDNLRVVTASGAVCQVYVWCVRT